ncbi:hypothetical protein MGWOODY_Mmi2258 [hydrothermal vent metagenome]|uniref:Uncharacterized protein n=1 Tax=hydrothermal vent metagenome TaxID=652676 RepID=A0A160VHW7_9ZZZZ
MIRLFFVLVLAFTACLFADPAITRKINFQQERAFKHEVFRYFRYFRIQTDDVELTFDEIDNNVVFTATVNSRRNNYEEMILKTFARIGRVIIGIPDSRLNHDQLFIIPSIITVNCNIPVRRDNSYISASANNKAVAQFTNGALTAEGFLYELRGSMEGSFTGYDNTSMPSILTADVDFENLIAARLALEGKNNPRLSTVLNLASKAKYIPGVERKIEAMMLEKMKTKNAYLLFQVFGYHPGDPQLKRIGKQVFYHIQMEPGEILDTHTNDSLRYVWKGRKYPEPLNEYYREYNLKYGIKRPGPND